MFIKAHFIAVVDRDKDGNIIYLKDKNPIKGCANEVTYIL